MVKAKVKEVSFSFDDGSYYIARPTMEGDTACGGYANRVAIFFINKGIIDFVKRVQFLHRLTWIQHPLT